jgi:hypothetical protein
MPPSSRHLNYFGFLGKKTKFRLPLYLHRTFIMFPVDTAVLTRRWCPAGFSCRLVIALYLVRATVGRSPLTSDIRTICIYVRYFYPQTRTLLEGSNESQDRE